MEQIRVGNHLIAKQKMKQSERIMHQQNFIIELNRQRELLRNKDEIEADAARQEE